MLWDGSSIIIDRVASNFGSNAVVLDDAIKLARGELSCHPFISIIRFTMFNMPDNGQYASQWSTCFSMLNVFWNVKYVSHCSIYFTMFHITQCLTMFNIIPNGQHASQWLSEFSLSSSAHAPRRSSQKHLWQPLPSPSFLFL